MIIYAQTMVECNFIPPYDAVSSKQSNWINARWSEWLPFATLMARRTSDPAAKLHELKTTHRSRVISLLSAKVGWDAIRRSRLDNPELENGAFEFQLRAAVERRRTRIGRVKGVKRRGR